MWSNLYEIELQEDVEDMLNCVGVGRRGWGIYIERRGRLVLDWLEGGEDRS